VINEEFTGNESINPIKKEEYKNLRDLKDFSSRNNMSYQRNQRCRTEPDEIIPGAKFRSIDFANIQPFVPKQRLFNNNNENNGNFDEDVDEE
jgi:hypothetical protein